jgi:hypothetical protein
MASSVHGPYLLAGAGSPPLPVVRTPPPPPLASRCLRHAVSLRRTFSRSLAIMWRRWTTISHSSLLLVFSILCLPVALYLDILLPSVSSIITMVVMLPRGRMRGAIGKGCEEWAGPSCLVASH